MPDAVNTGAPMLELQGIHTYYDHIHALKGITMSVNEGEIVALIGGNGAGKTTTLRTISGMMKPRTGTLTYRGKTIAGIPA
uniref:ATP-binding cassette domain-containing protein n=1 Tax=Deinococcus sp. TaxID=47478 RepID=UPI002869A0DF